MCVCGVCVCVSVCVCGCECVCERCERIVNPFDAIYARD